MNFAIVQSWARGRTKPRIQSQELQTSRPGPCEGHRHSASTHGPRSDLGAASLGGAPALKPGLGCGASAVQPPALGRARLSWGTGRRAASWRTRAPRSFFSRHFLEPLIKHFDPYDTSDQSTFRWCDTSGACSTHNHHS